MDRERAQQLADLMAEDALGGTLVLGNEEIDPSGAEVEPRFNSDGSFEGFKVSLTCWIDDEEGARKVFPAAFE